MQQSKLFDEEPVKDDYDKLVPNSSFEVGKAVRNATFRQIQVHLPECRQRVLEVILSHPKGVCNKEIALELGWAINSVTGRVSELRGLGLVGSNGTKLMPDHRGRMHPNTIWRAL